MQFLKKHDSFKWNWPSVTSAHLSLWLIGWRNFLEGSICWFILGSSDFLDVRGKGPSKKTWVESWTWAWTYPLNSEVGTLVRHPSRMPHRDINCWQNLLQVFRFDTESVTALSLEDTLCPAPAPSSLPAKTSSLLAETSSHLALPKETSFLHSAPSSLLSSPTYLPASPSSHSTTPTSLPTGPAHLPLGSPQSQVECDLLPIREHLVQSTGWLLVTGAKLGQGGGDRQGPRIENCHQTKSLLPATGVHPCSCKSQSLPAPDTHLTNTDSRTPCHTCMTRWVGRGWVGIRCFSILH